MERATRLIVLVSTLLAGVAHAWLAGMTLPQLPWAAGVAFAVTFALARISLALALAPALVFAYIAPAVLMVTFRGADFHQILIWLAALAGPVMAASTWSCWHVPSMWKAPMVAWALVVALTWPVIVGREIDFSLLAAYANDTPNGILAGQPSQTAAWVASVALAQLVGLLWLDLLWARFGAERLKRAERAVFVPLLLSIAIGSLAGLCQRYVNINWLNPGDWPSQGRAAGLMLDANSFGTAAAIWMPLAVVLAWRLRRPGWLGVLFTLLLFGGMWSSGSRTALLVGVCGLAALIVGWGRQAQAWQARLAPVVVLVGLAVLVVAGAVSARTGDRASPLFRVLQTIPRAETGGIKRFAEEMWVRNGYGIAAARAITEHPATGIGIGAFNVLSPDYFYRATGALIPGDNAQNWWRQQLVELGIIGAAPSILFSIVILLLIWKGAATGDHAAAATVVRGVLVGIGLASLLGVTTQHPALWITFVTLIYWLGALVNAPAAVTRPMWSTRVLWGSVLALAFVVAALQFRSALGDLRVPMRAVRTGFPYAYGFSAAEPDPEHGEVRWTAKRAVGVLRADHRYFALTMWTLQAEGAPDPVRVTLSRSGTPVAEIESRSAQPITRLIRVPDAQRFLMIETDVSRPMEDGRGLKVAGKWLREVPAGTSPEVVIP